MTQSESPTAPAARWPGVIGTIGIVVAVIMFIDKLDDLLLVPVMMNEQFWRKFLLPDMAEFVARAMPPRSWLVSSSLIGMALAILLLFGSLRLRRRRQSGVGLCRAWAWIAIVWVVLDIGRALWWMSAYGDELAGLAGTGWEGAAVFGILLALAILLAFPAFLLVWFSRPAVRTEFLSWQE